MSGSEIGIGWQVGTPSGWGMYGYHLALELKALGYAPAVLMADPGKLSDEQRQALAPLVQASSAHATSLMQGKLEFPGPVLKAMSDDLGVPDILNRVSGAPDIGVVFFESGQHSAAAIAAAKQAFPLIITGSTWNDQVLHAHGLTETAFCPQGVDTKIFHPRPKAGRFKDRFVVFSGGKFEYRKAQDLVLAGFRAFQARHPEALLITAWHNMWPQSVRTMALSPHVEGVPDVVEGRLDLGPWMAANGLPEDAWLDLGVLSHEETASILAEADVGLFPNRCEGGTNLVAMEAMACGVPVILSANTGHLDLIGAERCFDLPFQIPLGEVANKPEWTGWGESALGEIDAALEAVFNDTAGAKSRGDAAAQFMAGWSWPEQIRRLVEAVRTVC